jgi:hypothetical protein
MNGRFSGQLGRFAGRAKHNLDATRRAVAIKLFSAIIMDTPVLTGRLRGNWQTSINSPLTAPIDRNDLTGAEAIRDVEKMVAQSRPTDAMYLRNNLPYAYRIEYEGWSKVKAPEGMVRRNVARFRRILNEAVRENRT